METGQVKSRQRVSDHGEVFTSSREVDVNVDLHFAAEKRRRRSNLLPRTRPSKRAGEYICYYTYEMIFGKPMQSKFVVQFCVE